MKNENSKNNQQRQTKKDQKYIPFRKRLAIIPNIRALQKMYKKATRQKHMPPPGKAIFLLRSSQIDEPMLQIPLDQN